MSETPADLDLREQIARIDRDLTDAARMREETRKFVAEAHKLQREAEKFRAEEIKLWRDWRLAPWIVIGGFVAALIGGLIARLS
jgi:hypothetical protein